MASEHQRLQMSFVEEVKPQVSFRLVFVRKKSTGVLSWWFSYPVPPMFTVAHPGNRRFRQLIMEKKDEYQKAIRRDDKTRITLELVQSLRNGPDGGRFLLYDPKTELWYDVGDDYAKEKGKSRVVSLQKILL